MKQIGGVEEVGEGTNEYITETDIDNEDQGEILESELLDENIDGEAIHNSQKDAGGRCRDDIGDMGGVGHHRDYSDVSR